MSFSRTRGPRMGIRRSIVGLFAAFVLCLQPLIAQAQNLTLNLKGADINALIGTISEITGTNFIVDPRVKGKVTVISSRAIDSDEAYQVFLSILKVHGFAAIPAGDVVKIVPDATAKTDAIPNITGRISNPGDQLITRVIQVDNVNAAQLVPILRPLIPQNGHLAAYPSSNVLIISDRAANIARLNEIIQRIDRAGDNDIEVIPLKYASGTEMVRIIGALHKSTGGGVKGGPALNKLTLAADQRTNSIILAGERTARLQARATIARLDTAPEVTGNTHVVYLKYAKAEDLVPVLTGLGKTKQAAAAQGEHGGGSAVRARSTKSFDIQADPATNALVITAQPDIFRSLQSVIRQLDIRRAQVLIEAIIAEISPGRNLSLGVQWRAANDIRSGVGPVAGTSFSNSGSTIGDAVANPLNVGNGLSLGFLDGTVSLPGSDEILNLALLVNAAAGDALTNILSTPTLVTLDNQEAEIIVADNVPIATGTQSNVSNGGDPFTTIERQDVGITLKVTPQINEGDAILLDVYQEVSGFRFDAQVDDIITNKRTIDTHVVVDDKQVLVLGGLLTDELTETESSVPLLGDIPVLGLLFKSRSTTVDRKNLMVFLRPTILRESKDSVYHTNIRYNDLRSKQLEHRERGIQLMSDELSPLLNTLDEVEAKMEVEAKIEESVKTSDHGFADGE